MYDGAANQLTEMIPVSRIIAQIYQIFIALARKYFVFVLNTSDLRPVSMTTDAAMRLIRNPDEFFGSIADLARRKIQEHGLARSSRPANVPADIAAARQFLDGMARGKTAVPGRVNGAWMDIDPNATALLFYEHWARQQYGLDNDSSTASAAAKVWQTYFNIPYIASGRSDNSLSDLVQRYATDAAKEVAENGAVSKDSVSNAHSALEFCDNSTMATINDLVSTANSIMGKVPSDRQPFVQYHLVVGLLH